MWRAVGLVKLNMKLSKQREELVNTQIGLINFLPTIPLYFCSQKKTRMTYICVALQLSKVYQPF